MTHGRRSSFANRYLSHRERGEDAIVKTSAQGQRMSPRCNPHRGKHKVA